MRAINPSCLVLGCLVVLLVSAVIPRESSESSQPRVAPSHRETRAIGKAGALGAAEPFDRRADSQKKIQRAAERVQISASRAPEIGHQSAHEQLLASLKTIESGGAVNVDQLVALLGKATVELGPTEFALMLNKVAALIAAQHLEADLNLVSIGDVRSRQQLAYALVEAIAERDPARAARWAATLPEAALRDSSYRALAMKWGESDVEACRNWAESVSDAVGRVSAFEGLTWAWTMKDPQSAYAWAAQLPDTELRDRVFVKMSKLVTAQDPQRGAEWALRFPEGSGRTEALDYAVFQWAGKNLEATAAWASALENPELRESTLVAVARSWSNRDPQNATTWAAQLDNDQARASALTTTTRKWAEVNPAEAARWITELPSRTERAAIFENVTHALASVKPDAVETWLNAVFDSELRLAGQRMIAKQMQGQLAP